MTRPIYVPILHTDASIIGYQRIGFDYKSEHALRGTPPRYRLGKGVGRSLRRRFKTVALQP